MLQKKAYYTSLSFYSPKNNQSHPFTQYPVPVQNHNNNHNHNHNHNLNQQYRNRDNRPTTTDYKIYKNTQFKANKQLISHNYTQNHYNNSAIVYKNPGLMNIGRKINLNGYEQENMYGEAQAIRKYGMQYSRKLQNRYNSPTRVHANMHRSHSRAKISRKNQEKQMKYWYQQRNDDLQHQHLEFLKKMQKILSNQQLKSNLGQVETSFHQANKLWELETVQKCKKCFQS